MPNDRLPPEPADAQRGDDDLYSTIAFLNAPDYFWKIFKKRVEEESAEAMEEQETQEELGEQQLSFQL